MKSSRPGAGAAFGLLLAASFGLWTPDAHAVAPGARWHTLDTPHFRVHFHEGRHMYELAQKAARMCEAAHALLAPRLGWTPSRRTDVLLTDDVDSANGSAYTLYRPWMRLYAEVPDDLSVLNDFDDHLWNLIVHEYTHVLHLDTVTGLPAMVNAVFGQVLIPNAFVPRWLTEGLATFEESNLSDSGRLRSSLFRMWLRASVLQAPFRLDEVSHVPQRWPRGNLAYLYGGDFLSFVADRVGEEALPAFFQLHGGRVIPFALNDSAASTLGPDFVRLYEVWLEDTRDRFRAELAPVRAAGLTASRQLTHVGYGTSQARFTPDGERIVYLESGPDRRPQLRWMRTDGTDDRLIRELWTGGALDVSPDGARVAISLGDVVDEYYVYEDLYEVALPGGELTRLTRGLRATEPAYAPEGDRLAFVARDGGGHAFLGLLDLRTGAVTRLLDATEEARPFTPSFTPDGRGLVFSQKEGTGRRVVHLDLETRATTLLVQSEAQLQGPRLTPDGLLLFSSDRTGIYNLHVSDPRTGAVRQLTNVTTGAFSPQLSPGGEEIAFISYSHRGYDVSVMAVADGFGGWLPDRPRRPPPVYVDDPRKVRPVRAYDPLETLFPLYWLPLYGLDPKGPVIGVTTGGGDILDRHLYALDVTFGLGSLEPGFFASYTNRTFHPGITVYATSGIAQAAGFDAGLYDRQTAAGAHLSFPFSSFQSSTTLSLSYEYRYYQPRFTAQAAPDDPDPPPAPKEGAAAPLSVSFAFSNARGYADSISAEEGQRVSATVRHSGPFTLGDFTLTAVEARYQAFLRAPWRLHHVFALQLQGGAAWGDVGDRPVYALGGIGLYEPFLQLVSGRRVGSGALRGYPSRALAGNAYALGTLEYRFPLAVFDRGIDSLPFFLRRLHGAAFTDVGATGPGPLRWDAPRTAVGLEARAEVVLGYALSTTLRLGVARGLSEGGLWSGYLTLGSTF